MINEVALNIEFVLFAVCLLLLLSIFASKTTGKLGVPALLVFIIVGIMAGSNGAGIQFDDPQIAQSLGVIALVFILFAGGLDTHFSSIKPIIPQGITLSTLGVVITSTLVGVFAWWVLDLSLLEGMLLGAIVSSTDAAAVFSILRAKGVNLKGKLRPLLELESGSNDPMAVFLTMGFVFMLVSPDTSLMGLIPMFFIQMTVGFIVGYGMGLGSVFLINRLKLEYEGLYPVLTIAMVGLTYSISALLEGNGFLAVYITGLVMSTQAFLHKKSLIRFHDGLAWLMQIAMFLTLGLLVNPTAVFPLVGTGLLISAFLILVARPASIFISLLPYKFKMRQKLLISWVGLRGAVPIILATFPMLAGVPQADVLFNLVFFIVITSTIIQGTTIPLVARLLKVDAPMKKTTYYPLEFEKIEGLESDLFEVEIPDYSPMIGKHIYELNFPQGTLVVLMHRDNSYMVPHGSTQIIPNDNLLVLGEKSKKHDIRRMVDPKYT